MKNKSNIFTIMKWIVLIFIVLATLLPFIHMLSVSLSNKFFVMQNKVGLIPKGFTIFAYKFVLSDSKIYSGYLNTIILVSVGTAVSLTITSCAAFALSRKHLIFHKFFSIYVIIPMFFSGGMIPTYLTIKGYHIGNFRLIDTMWAVICLYSVSVWYLIIMRSFFFGISQEILDAAKIDGLTDIDTFLRIVLPLSKPVLVSIGLFYAVDYWNAYFVPFLYINTPQKYPLQLVIRSILTSDDSSNSDVFAASSAIASAAIKYAYIIVSIIPVVIIYPFMQKYFEKGVMLGSVKG